MAGEDEAVRKLQEKVVRVCAWRCCLNCDLWGVNQAAPGTAGPMICTLAGERPPPDVLVYACPRWIAYVPF